MYKDQHTPWKEGVNVLQDWERIALFAQCNPKEFVKAWLDIEEGLRIDLKCATLWAKWKKRGNYE